MGSSTRMESFLTSSTAASAAAAAGSPSRKRPRNPYDRTREEGDAPSDHQHGHDPDPRLEKATCYAESNAASVSGSLALPALLRPTVTMAMTPNWNGHRPPSQPQQQQQPPQMYYSPPREQQLRQASPSGSGPPLAQFPRGDALERPLPTLSQILQPSTGGGGGVYGAQLPHLRLRDPVVHGIPTRQFPHANTNNFNLANTNNTHANSYDPFQHQHQQSPTFAARHHPFFASAQSSPQNQTQSPPQTPPPMTGPPATPPSPPLSDASMEEDDDTEDKTPWPTAAEYYALLTDPWRQSQIPVYDLGVDPRGVPLQPEDIYNEPRSCMYFLKCSRLLGRGSFGFPRKKRAPVGKDTQSGANAGAGAGARQISSATAAAQRREASKEFEWRKMSFVTGLPKKQPVVRYITATCYSKAHRDSTDKKKKVLRMHAVMLANEDGTGEAGAYVLVHIRAGGAKRVGVRTASFQQQAKQQRTSIGSEATSPARSSMTMDDEPVTPPFEDAAMAARGGRISASPQKKRRSSDPSAAYVPRQASLWPSPPSGPMSAPSSSFTLRAATESEPDRRAFQ